MDLTKEEQKKLDTYPKEEITKEELMKLPEYSRSVPTQSGSMGIKKWRHRTPFNANDEEAIWFIGKVEEGMNNYYRVVFKEQKLTKEQLDKIKEIREYGKSKIIGGHYSITKRD